MLGHDAHYEQVSTHRARAPDVLLWQAGSTWCPWLLLATFPLQAQALGSAPCCPSAQAQQLNREIFECIYYASLKTSMELAKVHGPYETYQGSPVSKGVLQQDMWGVKNENSRCVVCPCAVHLLHAYCSKNISSEHDQMVLRHERQYCCCTCCAECLPRGSCTCCAECMTRGHAVFEMQSHSPAAQPPSQPHSLIACLTAKPPLVHLLCTAQQSRGRARQPGAA